mgnify:CR=1 FL=1
MLMITLSDNTATNMILDAVGIAAVNARLQAMGLKETVLYKKVFKPAEGPATVCGVAVETDDATGLAMKISPLRIGGRLSQAAASVWVSGDARRSPFADLRVRSVTDLPRLVFRRSH